MSNKQTIDTKALEIAVSIEQDIPSRVGGANRVFIRAVIARAIMDAKDEERQRCLDICAAEREWGDFHPDDVMGKIERGESARIIPGWNAPSEDE